MPKYIIPVKNNFYVIITTYPHLYV